MGDRVVGVAHGSVPRGAVGDQFQPGDALLRGLHEVEAPVVHGEREAAHLADRLGAVGEQVGVVGREPARPLRAPRLLVRGEHQPDRTPRCAPGAHPLAHHRQHDRVEVLHVDRTAAPHVVVDQLAGERVHLPVGGDRGHHVGVPVDQQRWQRGVAALRRPLGDQGGTPRLRLEHRAGDPHLVEQTGDVLGRLPLPLRAVGPEVGRVETDQVTAQAHDLLGRGGDGVHDCHPATAWPQARPSFRQPARRLGIVLWLSGRSPDTPCPGGGIGRRASLRC